jgi:hypothetical protein
MKRTQIYIDEKTFDYLKTESKLKGVTISDVIRESIRDRRLQSTKRIIAALESVAGVWKNRGIDTEKYIRRLRKDRSL